jgi:hypothetical protein
VRRAAQGIIELHNHDESMTLTFKRSGVAESLGAFCNVRPGNRLVYSAVQQTPTLVKAIFMKPKELLTELHARLRTAIEADYKKLTSQFEDVCGYAICAPPYIESIFPSYRLASDGLEESAAFFPPEWESFDTLTFDPEFLEFCETLHDRRVLYDKNKKDGLDAKSVFNTIFAVMKELEAEGLFGDKSSGRYLTIWDVGNDEELIIKTSQKLNSKKVHAEAKRALLGE